MDAAEICAMGLAVTLILVVVRGGNPAFDLPMKRATVILFASLLLSLASPLFTYLQRLMETTAVKPYAEILLRALGVAALTEVAGGICRECKEGTVGIFVELAGRLEILILCLPLMEEILESVRGLLSL